MYISYPLLRCGCMSCPVDVCSHLLTRCHRHLILSNINTIFNLFIFYIPCVYIFVFMFVYVDRACNTRLRLMAAVQPQHRVLCAPSAPAAAVRNLKRACRAAWVLYTRVRRQDCNRNRNQDRNRRLWPWVCGDGALVSALRFVVLRRTRLLASDTIAMLLSDSAFSRQARCPTSTQSASKRRSWFRAGKA